jgi:ATP-binding protein involved in chromosome partitioning
VALLDARKGIDMFNQLGTPIFGMIENMSTHICSNCGHEEHTFGHGGVAAEAAKLNVPLLAELPLELDIRLAADGGAPIVVSKPDSTAAQAFRTVAKQLIADGVA